MAPTVVFLCFITAAVAALPVVNWSHVVRASKTLPTLQVVDNPLLNDATTNPVAAQAWRSLGALNASRVRYAAWFPFPQWSVPELAPPNATARTTSWNFTLFMEQLGHFAANVQSAVLEISTMPLWLFKRPWTLPGYNPGANPNAVDWQYSAGRLRPNSTFQAAAYFARIAEFLVNGSFLDEFGNRVGGGPAWGVGRVPWWEVLNEPEGEFRGGGPGDYVALFDQVVLDIRARADPAHRIRFQGLALEGHGEWSWYKAFFNAANHAAAAQDAVNAASFHFYATPSHRVDNATWAFEMFQALDAFRWELRHIVALRDSLSPATELSVDEMGAILPNDNAADAPTPSSLYFNAANALFAAAFVVLSDEGIDVAGCSQLAGCPVMPEYKISQAQFPSVSLLNWTNGLGNARYWGLKLLLEHFKVGDEIVAVSDAPVVPSGGPTPACGDTWNYDSLGLQAAGRPPPPLRLACPAGSVIAALAGGHNFSVAAGPSPYLVGVGDVVGYCGETTPAWAGLRVRNDTCTDSGTLHAFASQHCVGRPSCELHFANASMADAAGLPVAACPFPVRIVAAFTCSGADTQGTAEPAGRPDDRVLVQARLCGGAAKTKKLIVVNRSNAPATVSLERSGLRWPATAFVVTPSADGIQQVVVASPALTMEPFGVAVVVEAS